MIIIEIDMWKIANCHTASLTYSGIDGVRLTIQTSADKLEIEQAIDKSCLREIKTDFQESFLIDANIEQVHVSLSLSLSAQPNNGFEVLSCVF